MQLGHLYVKLAQEQPEGGQLETLNQRLGVGQTPHTTGGLPALGGTASLQQFGMAGIADIFGQEYSAFVPVIMPLLQQFLPQEVWSELTKQRRMGVGPGTVSEAQVISKAMTQANGSLMARMADRTAAGLEAAMKSDKVPAFMKSILGWAGSAARSNPAVAGQIMGALRQMPTVGPILNQFFRDVPTSYAPLIIAATQANGGVFDPGVLQKMVGEFETNYNRGLYQDKEGNPLDANMALGGHALSAAVLGENHDAMASVEFARLASSLMEHKLAADPNMAYTMLRQMGPLDILKNPTAFDQRMRSVAAKLNSTVPAEGVPKLVAGALQAAAKTGIPFDTALERLSNSAVRRQFWERSGAFGNRMSLYDSLEAARDDARTRGAAEADSMKALTAWTTLTSQGRSALHDYMANPSPQKAQAMFAASRQSPTMHKRHAFNPHELLSKLDENQRVALDQGEMIDTFRDSRLLSDIASRPDVYKDVLTDPTSDSAGKLMSRANMYELRMMNDPRVRAIALASTPAPALKASPYDTPYTSTKELLQRTPANPEPMTSDIAEPSKPVTTKP